MTQQETLGAVVAYCLSCFAIILIGSILKLNWTFPLGGVLLILGPLIFMYARSRVK